MLLWLNEKVLRLLKPLFRHGNHALQSINPANAAFNYLISYV
jgi:hypothetical protein